MPLDASQPFDPGHASESLAGVPEAPGVFALYAQPPEREGLPPAEPYLARTVNLRRRLARMLAMPEANGGPNPETRVRSKRLQLAHLVRRIEFTVTGSEFESILALYQASLECFGERARRRLHLKAPVFLRMSTENPYPRVYVTSRVSKSAGLALFGPFPSRTAAERYAESVLNLFELRRCTEDLHPDPAFPGCPYSEMKMCLAPCFQGCTDARYRQEAAAVLEFLSTRGQATLGKLEHERDAASEALDFERAASLHKRTQKVAAAASLASEAVHPLAELEAMVVQKSARPGEAALFRLHGGVLHGPAHFSMVGARLANEESGSSSLFAQPFAIEPVALKNEAGSIAAAGEPVHRIPKDLLERRLDETFERLSSSAPKSVLTQTLSDHLSIFARWFYRPASRRAGEIVFAGEDGRIPRKALLRAISRVLAPGAQAAAG